MNNIVTRFAPSPTGMLHIGGARTALFNYLFARNQKGKFLLRVEDTDKARSTDEAIQEILSSLEWLGLKFDDEIYYQSQLENRHKEIADQLLKEGKAYHCYATSEELNELRQEAIKNNKRFKYDRRWRDRDPKDTPEGVRPVVRIKAPISGVTEFEDQVQGKITIANQEQDDFIILRSDGTPTYMLAVVVDDHDMGVTHIIRGDDHLTNCAKQILLYEALGWEKPVFAHIPLIYGPDGKKLSKRHGATAVSEYQKLGYLPEAMRNYLLRLGFAHGDDEIISDSQAIEWFNFDGLGKSPARFDMKKLDNVNGHYLREAEDDKLVRYIADALGFLSEVELDRLTKIVPELKVRAITLNDLVLSSKFIKDDFLQEAEFTDKAKKILNETSDIANLIIEFVSKQDDFTDKALYENSKIFAEDNNIKVKQVAGFLRAAITASHISPSIFKVMEVFGKDVVMERLNLSVSLGYVRM